MADEFQNWWATGSSASSSSSALTSVGSFGWPAEMADIKASSSMDLTLSSQAMDWNHQTLLRGGKAESSFRSAVQEDLNSSTNFHPEAGIGSSSQEQWREKIYSRGSEDSSVNEYKQINRDFLMDQPQFGSQISSTSFQMDPTTFQGLLSSENQQQQSHFENQPMNNYQYQASYGVNTGELLPSSWSKFPQFTRSSPPKQPPHSPLQFSNNAPFWNATSAPMNEVRSSFFPASLQTQLPPPTFDEKPKNTLELVAKKSSSSSSEASNKRPRNETPSPLPAFKVRKEKMGDRITALQQLVSPFGKTDTASVLSEAIEYINFLHEQVSVLSTPYMKSGASMQHQQTSDKSKEPERPKQDLRSRGLCLVPVSSTFPVTHEATVDFWNPTFGGTFR
ncbi:basic helix-loop-helix (bHLH) DNA-binding superfamily protein [Actinidia rufa]|uniref:Basic helix-loop-helix (BHLH) DNA-binding superfamily protein n=1 Tax=Actinidia rufa TaxID=165716 RepID=A0A7J0DG49_9ERIC|nr:basic helix-loop-helix (bHLH) DNA-binding superfamily protein [Actinidia rufa]